MTSRTLFLAAAIAAGLSQAACSSLSKPDEIVVIKPEPGRPSAAAAPGAAAPSPVNAAAAAAAQRAPAPEGGG